MLDCNDPETCDIRMNYCLKLSITSSIVTDTTEYAVFPIEPNYPIVRFYMKKLKLKPKLQTYLSKMPKQNGNF